MTNFNEKYVSTEWGNFLPLLMYKKEQAKLKKQIKKGLWKRFKNKFIKVSTK